MPNVDEKICRLEASLFLDEASRNLRIPKVANATAHVFFHRFYALQSPKKHSCFEVATTCLFLASKVEESARKLENVIITCYCLWHYVSTTSNSALLRMGPQVYSDLRLRILKCERILLHTISFDLCVEHPYKFLIETIKAVHHSGMIKDTQKKDFAQRAVNFVNDRCDPPQIKQQ